jgi:hypothetical protein
VGRDSITGLVVVAASLALFWATLGLQAHPMVPVGPGFYPRIVLGVTATLGVLLVVFDVLARRRAMPARAAGPRPNYFLVVAGFAIFAAYVISMPYLGFRVATFAFLVAMQSLLDPPRNARRALVVAIVAILGTAVVYYAFERYLHVLLPRGRWTSL